MWRTKRQRMDKMTTGQTQPPPARTVALGNLPEPKHYERLRLVLTRGALPVPALLAAITAPTDPDKPREHQVAALAELCEEHGVTLKPVRFDGQDLPKLLNAEFPVAESEAVRNKLGEILGIQRVLSL